MRVSDIIRRVRNIAGDVDVQQFTDGDIIRWINDACRECASDNQLLQKKATLTVTRGIGGYSIPDDILKLHSIRYDDSKLAILSLQEAEEKGIEGSSTGTPDFSYLWAGKIELYPTPDNNSSTLVVYYTRIPVEVEGEMSEPDLPAPYHARLVDYCLAQVAQQDDDLNRYQLKMQEFRTGVQNLKDQPEWNNDLYPYMVVSDRDAGYDC